ncbi:MAG: hypothetical protein IAI50_08060 [Candidatus Eremiobacteraeota bacterium]|nr:hypothetical protein [Candidatus Eremiobacteraeota bacterium]
MNAFFVIPMHTNVAIAWNPHDPTDLPVPECDYYGKVLAIFDDLMAERNLTVFVDFNHKELPRYGRDVVVFALGDEWGRYPAYSHRVAAVFKSMGTKMWRPQGIPRLNVLGITELLNYFRLRLLRAPSAIRYTIASVLHRRRAAIMTVPLGTYRQLGRAMIDMPDRKHDVYFGGSMIQRQIEGFSIKRWLKNPKTLSRIEMGEELKRYADTHPDRTIATDVTLGFHDTTLDDVSRYSDSMMNAKVALVPRGTAYETFRWFEALRSGCVIVGDPVPPWTFYDGAPMIAIREWKELGATLDHLFSDMNALEELHRASVTWWETMCSPAAVAAQAAAFTKRALTGQPTAKLR